MGVFDIVFEKLAEVSQVNGCVWYSHGKTCWSQSRRWMCLIVIGKPSEVSWRGVCLTLSWKNLLTSSKRCVFDIVMEKPAEVSQDDGCVWYFYWLQKVFPWLSNTSFASADFSWFSHDYVKNTPLQLTSAGFSMTMSSTHLFNWLQQVFPWLCQAHTSSTDFSRFFHDYVKHTPLQLTSAEEVCAWHSHGKTCWSQSKRCVLDIVMEKPAEVSQDDGCVWYSHGKTCWNQSKRCVLDIVMKNLLKSV
jgi:G:T-mismatch repair DNA endonuclease (very short patch repair protein)